MKVVFVANAVENLAIEFLSSFLKANGHEVELVFDPMVFSNEAVGFKKLADFFDTKKEIALQVLKKEPDLVGFSVFTINYQRILAVAREIKDRRKEIPIIFGGIHPTCVPEVVVKEKCVDIVCIGEGEYALLELLKSLESGKPRTDIKNLWFKKDKRIIKNPCRSLIDDLDKLPFPDKDLFYQIYPKFITDDYSALSSRGCPFSCTYCANNVLNKVYRGLGRPVRRRSPKNVIEELVIAKEKYSPKQVTFVDDVFVQDEGWLEEFVKDYKKKVGIPYAAITHPRFVTPQTARLLSDSGCFLLMFGIQSASEETRKTILHRYESNREIEEAAANCHKNGLFFSIDHIFNIPGEGLKEYEKALGFYNQLRPSIINAFWLQYFPKTEIIQTAIKEKAIKKSMVRMIEQGLTSTSVVVGIGNKDTFNPNLRYTNFQFLFVLLPVLPKWFMDWVIKKRLYDLPFRPPMVLNVGFKFVTNIFKGRGIIYISIIKETLFFMRKNLFLKWRFNLRR